MAVLAGASRPERRPDREDYRNGYRCRRWHSRVGSLELSIPRLREGGELAAELFRGASAG